MKFFLKMSDVQASTAESIYLKPLLKPKMEILQ
jgi:hypothetical protein